MTLPHGIMWLVIVLVGIPSAWRNPTSAALVLCWIAGETVFVLTGDSLPVQFYIFPDLFVIAVIYAKPDYRPCPEYRGTLHQLKCLITERSPADRAVLAVFLLMWALYVSTLHDYYRWWLLWGLAIAQLLIAGIEALPLLFRRDADVANRTPEQGPLLVAYPGGGKFG